MMQVVGSCCCVCGTRDARALVEIVLAGGSRATLCGSHALMHRRSREQARSASELRELFHDRRGRRERRGEADELGAALTAAFNGDRRENSRRHGT
jgi:hypothetical protein